MIEEALRRQLEPVVARRQRLSLAWRLSIYWLACGLAGLALIGADRLLGSRPPHALGALYAVVAGATLWAIYRSRRLRPDYRAIARTIEQQNPDLKALLLAAVEQKPESPDGQFGYLQQQVLLQAVSHATDHDWMQAVSNRRLALAHLGWCGALSLLLFALLLLWPGRRPSSPIGAAILHGGYSVTVTPGDTEVEKGSPVVILARFEGRLPAAVNLLFGPAGETPQRITLTKSLDDPVFGGIIQDVASDLLYRVEYADRSTRDYMIGIYQRPELVRADAKIAYPAYTKLPEKTVEDTRQISVVEGSEVTLVFTLNKPVTTARLAPKTGIAPALTIDSQYPNVLTTTLTAGQSQQYELHLADAQGRSNKLPPRFVIDVQKNLPPQIKPVFPGNDVVVSPLEEVALEAKVADDYGLVGYGLTYSLVGTQSQEIKLSPAEPLVVTPSGVSRVAGVPPSNRGHELAPAQAGDARDTQGNALTGTLPTKPDGASQIRYLLALEGLKAEPDQLLTYYFWADDVGPDGQPRRTASDMYFAEVRPFEESFRESQSFQDQQNQQQQQSQGDQQNQSGDQLARLQKQIIIATWNVKQQAERSGGMQEHQTDMDVVRQSQSGALEQARQALTQAEDPSAAKSLEAAAGHMETAVEHLTKASDANATAELAPALASEQSAYQELLKLRQREHQVARGRNSSSRGNNANSERMQQQLQQLELTQRENRYETQQLAQSRQQDSQRNDLEMLNRLRDLARRQSEMSDKLREAEAALRQASNEQQRQDTLRELQRLRDEQLLSLRDADEIGRQMDSSQNRQRLADARQRLDDSRSQIRDSAEAMEQGQLSQAQTSATRAQRQLEQMRQELQKQTSSQFTDQMRDMRDQAQQLDQRQDEIAQEIGRQIDSRQKSLAGPNVGPELADRIGQQKESMEKLLDEMKNVSDQAESSEPLLSRKLYDTLREASTGNTDQALETTGELLRRDLLPQAQQIERRAGEGINQLRQGVEEAAKNVLGDEAESLRLARQQLDELIKQANGQNQGANSRGQRTEDASQRAQGQGQQAQDANQQMQDGQQGQQRAQDGEVSNPQSAIRNPQSGRSGQAQQPGSPRDGAQPQDSQTGRARADAGNRADPQGRGGNRRVEGVPPSNRGQDARDTNAPDGRDDPGARGPFTDENYGPWSNRLRDVQEMLPQQDLRDQMAQVWDSVRTMRAESKRHGQEPQWDLVQTQVIKPLTELRQRVSERLAQLQSNEAMVPIDRDPVPDRYNEMVRTYFENLGQGEK
jgi:hypothetical protein